MEEMRSPSVVPDCTVTEEPTGTPPTVALKFTVSPTERRSMTPPGSPLMSSSFVSMLAASPSAP